MWTEGKKADQPVLLVEHEDAPGDVGDLSEAAARFDRRGALTRALEPPREREPVDRDGYDLTGGIT
jgi:hypothetical protein